MYRIVNTANALMGPHGTHYVHDAARPFAVLFNRGKSEICARRFSSEKQACAFLRRRAQNAYCFRVLDRATGEHVQKIIWADDQPQAIVAAQTIYGA